MVEVVSDMSGAFIAGVKTHFTNSAQTVDWFHVVQAFTNAVKDVRLAEAKETSMPKASRWATLKNAEGSFTEAQVAALLDEEQVLAYRYQGKRYDCGAKLGYLEATVAFGLRHPEVGAQFATMLKGMS